jgi:hypothetical protein
MMFRNIRDVLLVATLSLVGTGWAQEKPAETHPQPSTVEVPNQRASVQKSSDAPWVTPTLKDTEKLQLQVISQKLEIAQLKAQAAQSDFDRARDEWSKLVLSLQKDGYTLNLEKLEYVKVPPPATPPK